MPDRAIVFVDGSNWYHSLKETGIPVIGDIDLGKVAQKLAGPSRTLLQTRFYTARVNQQEAPEVYAKQRRYLARLLVDPNIRACYGRLETRPTRNDLAEELAQYMAALQLRIDMGVFQDLVRMAQRNRNVLVTKEKAVDVMLAVDLVSMAIRDEYDAAYLLTADGDYTPAVEAVCELKKKVYCASPTKGAQLAAVATSYITTKSDFFTDCLYT